MDSCAYWATNLTESSITKFCQVLYILYREKLTELEDEQAKKSTSNKNNDPKQARNDAIKKLLIKNLKLAALIASKEIQLEEEKSRGVECKICVLCHRIVVCKTI